MPAHAPSPIKRRSSKPFCSALVHEFDAAELALRYDMEHAITIGEGASGSVVAARRHGTGETFAVKTVRTRPADADAFEGLRAEICVQKKLDHPNIAKVIESFCDEANGLMFIVMELCMGGSLVDRMDKRHGTYSEGRVATLLDKLCSAIAYCHQHGVVHRDIKLDNIVYESEAADAEPKLIDFGFACEVDRRPDGAMSEQLGTPSYMAPELWASHSHRRYDSQVDVWALGVVGYMLLSGHRPWHHKDMRTKGKMIQQLPLQFPPRHWSGRSSAAQDFLRTLLRKRPSDRPLAAAAISHPWLRRCSTVRAGPDAAHELERCGEIVSSLEAFCAAERIAKIAFEVVAFSMPPAKLDTLRLLFIKMDTDGSGTLSLAEFRSAMALHPEVAPAQLERLFHLMATVGRSSSRCGAPDAANDCELHYTEFLAAAVAGSGCLARSDLASRLRQAFDVLDVDHKGYLDARDVSAACGGHVADGDQGDGLTEDSAAKVLAQCQCHDGAGVARVDYEHFAAAVRRSFPMLPLDDCHKAVPPHPLDDCHKAVPPHPRGRSSPSRTSMSCGWNWSSSLRLLPMRARPRPASSAPVAV